MVQEFIAPCRVSPRVSLRPQLKKSDREIHRSNASSSQGKSRSRWFCHGERGLRETGVVHLPTSRTFRTLCHQPPSGCQTPGRNPNFMRERCIEAASMEYHTRRREVGGLFRHDPASGQRAERGDASPLHQRIDMFVRQQVLHPRGVAGAGLSMAMKLFQEIHSVRNTLAKALTARQNAKSETVAPTKGPSGAWRGRFERSMRIPQV